MYYDFFGFKEPPFSIAPDPRYLYLSERHKEALAHLMYGVQGQGGFIVITGEVGTGKTTVSRCFIENAPAHADIALILNPRLSAQELLSAICDELGVTHSADASIKELVDLINRDLLQAHAAGRHKVLMIDEAQNLSADVLEQLRLLTNLETAEKKLLQIVLLGQPELQQILALPKLRQLNQRVTARYHLDAINRNELPAYLSYRLGVAGMRGDVFTSGAVRQLYALSHGIPRLINLISDRALLGAYSEGEHEVTAGHIRRAAKEVAGRGKAGRRGLNTPQRPAAGSYLVLAGSFLLAVISTFWLFQQWSEPAARADAEAVDMPAPRVADNQRAPLAEPESRPKTIPQPPSFSFPEQALDETAAFRALFAIWAMDYPPGASAPACDFARASGMGCLERQGTRRSLAFLDRPAMLVLQDDAGNRGFVVLKNLSGDVAEIVSPGGSAQVTFASLEPFWFGEYLVLWQRSDISRGSAAASAQTARELWLGARMMELADLHSETAEANARIKRMPAEQQVRWYQSVRGLTVDGIAGAMTIIQINNDLDAEVPRLLGKKPAGEG